METHFFLKVVTSNQKMEEAAERLLDFHSLEAADAHIRHWLEEDCGLECYCGPQEEAALRAKNNGALPDIAFSCPEIREPADLEKYSGFRFYEYIGPVNLFVLAVYDQKSARRFRLEATKEYKLDKTFSDAADEMIEMLGRLERSFQEDVDYHMALEKVANLIAMDGLPMF